MKIGEKLKEQRTAAGLSQEALSERIGVSRQTISSWENDRSYPDIGSILKLSDLYSLSLDELLKEDENMRKHVEHTSKFNEQLWTYLFVLTIMLIPLAIVLEQCLEAISAARILTIAAMVIMPFLLNIRHKIMGKDKAINVVLVVVWIAIGISGAYFLVFGWILIYHTWLNKKGASFWLAIGLYFAVPIFIAISTFLPQIMEEGLFMSDSEPFGYTYRVMDVWYGQDEPMWVVLEEDGKTLTIDGETIGEFVQQEYEEGSSHREWRMVPNGHRTDEIILEWSIHSSEIQLKRITYGISSDGEEYFDWVWNVQLEQVPAFDRVVRATEGSVRGTISTIMNWYPDAANKGPEDFQRVYSLGESDEISFTTKDQEIEEITVIVEYHNGDRLETLEYLLPLGKNGEFILPEELYSLPRTEGAYLFIRIPWEDGAYLTRLNYE